MAWSGGSYSRPSTSVSPAVGSTTIDSAAMNTYTADVTTAINTCRNKDGSNNPIANLPMANYRHTGVGDGAALTDYASVNQVIDGPLTYCATPSAVGTDAYAVSLPINPVAYVAGNEFTFITDVANTGACTVNFNAIGAVAIKLPDGAGGFADPASGDVPAGAPVTVRHDGTRFVLMNPYVTLTTFGVTASVAELNYIDLTTGAGTVDASKAVVVDGSKDIGTFGEVTAATFTGTNITGALDGVLGGVTPAAATVTTLTTTGAGTLGGDVDAVNNTVDNCKTVQFNSEVDNGSKTTSFEFTFDTAQKQKATLTANTMTITLGNPTSVGNWILKIENGGLATITWATTSGSVLWASGTEPTWTASGTDLISVYYDGTNFYCQGSLAFA